ncbi:zona pellucida-binding protein 2 [Tiliqua scincoides]|uniref:zona pellucida-binding protein 2 n=1 Tax=Tiliqua scincoides TaxID=71010 RepID=UPI0034625800
MKQQESVNRFPRFTTKVYGTAGEKVRAFPLVPADQEPPATKENGPDKAQYPVKLIKENYIYGDTSHEVNTYVKVHTNSPYLLCMDLALSQSEIIDPHYIWIGPDGQNLKAKTYVNLTTTGKLMLLNFKENMSGSYTCTISYRAIRADMQAELQKFKTYKFMIYAYREPDYSYRISVHFTTKECSLAANKNFFEELMKVLNHMISYLACHIIQQSFKCYSVKRPQESLTDELFIIFQVNPFGPGWKTKCQRLTDCEDMNNNRVEKAQWFIREFFSKQQDILAQDFKTIPAIHYVANSFQVTRLDSCHQGFGKNNLIHSECANCCVACDPGTYSSNNDVVCQTCTNIRIKQYGATSC